MGNEVEFHFSWKFILGEWDWYGKPYALYTQHENMGLLTHYNTMPHFDTLKICSCGSCLEQANSPFLTMFSTLYGTYFFILNAL